MNREDAEAISAQLNHQVTALHEQPIASTPITENILQPLNPRYLDALEGTFKTLGGNNFADSDYSVNHSAEHRRTATMLNERKRAFGESEVDEASALSSVWHRGIKK